eukprot:TRINITY_DN915_c0_g1_i1.p2 TRINITY_DN915_c0_g1~~TRINITY_DN915_c0_g1_i1.p2  ORF type:complete len:101 (-),score=15.45 TRINITY_DN915_c0_g1_i1:26-328(-)
MSMMIVGWGHGFVMRSRRRKKKRDMFLCRRMGWDGMAWQERKKKKKERSELNVQNGHNDKNNLLKAWYGGGGKKRKKDGMAQLVGNKDLQRTADNKCFWH